MTSFIDADAILSGSEQWVQLDQKWGTPVDLDTEDDGPRLKTVFSTLDLKKSTFDSSFLFKRRKLGRNSSKKSMDYKEFLQDLNDAPRNTPDKQFYFVSGQILSAISVEEICDGIDDIFKSMDKLCSATSTVRINKKRKPSMPDIVQCSISTNGLSFDDTVVNASEKEKADSDDVSGYIDEVFGHLDSFTSERSSKESVTTLVRRFTSMLKSPIKCSPRKRRQCGDRFKELTEFWQAQSNGTGTRHGS
ncbi:uncharacterized protein LOC134750836 [Cydia strobilella]|uniref:uncharacterized protein LOC134750836 n=1 Tax=Cydia strobilella TaxID=1100964 RepID=UPI0030056500